MRGLKTLACVFVVALTAGSAFADHGPDSREDEHNNVRCDHSSDVSPDQPFSLSVDAYGAATDGDARAAEICNDDDDLALQGRIFVTDDQGGYVAADGDKDGPSSARGWERFNLDDQTLTCSDDSTLRGDAEKNDTQSSGVTCVLVLLPVQP